MKRYIRSSETSSKSTDPQSEYEYRKHIYLKRKHEFETLGEDDNNDVLSREEKMNIAKAEMDKVNPKSVKSAKDATFKINEIKASEAVSDDDNYNPYSFMVGDQLEWSGLYGGEYKGVVTNVTDEYITVDVMWTAEDTGDIVTNTRRFEIATDPEGRECIIVYRYRDTVGYVYPPSNSRSSKDATFKTDKRLSPTSERYNRKHSVTSSETFDAQSYAKQRKQSSEFNKWLKRVESAILRNDTTRIKNIKESLMYMTSSQLSNKLTFYLIDKLNSALTTSSDDIKSSSYGGAFDIEDDQYSAWKELASKSVEDSDGFYTDYTLYTDDQTYICMFGDKNLYEPDASYADYETESEQDAWDWFNSYTGFADEEDEYDDILYDDILESTQAINSSQYPYRQNDLNDKLDTLYDRACATFGEDLVNKIVVECGGPTPEENPDYWWTDSLDTEKFYHKLTELFLNKMLNYEDFEDASDMDIFAYNCVAEEYGLPTVEDLDSPGYVYDPQKVWEQFRNKITNISSTTGVYYPNGKEVTDIDLDTYLDYNFGTDRDKDNSKYTTEEKQRSVDYWFKKHDTIRGSESTEVVNSGYSPELVNVKSSRKIRASWTYYPYALYSYTPGDSETGIEGDKFDIIDVVKSADIDEAKRYFKNKRILWYPNSFVDRISDEDYNAFLKEQEELARYESAVKSHNGSADEVINSSYSPDLLNDLVNYYRSFDTMSSEEIWDEIVAEYNNEDLANDVLESLDHEEDVDLADEEGAYDVYSSSDIKASMGRYDEYFGKTAAATYGDLIADRLRGKSVSKRRDTANEPGGLIYEANKLGIDMWDLLEALEGMCNEGRAREIDDSTYKILGASDLADEEDLPQADQEYDSAKTSINSNKLPAIYHMITLPEGSVGIDYGGGKFDNAVEALAEQGVTLYVYDPYNRSQQHNRAAIKALRANGGADFAINSNVLNVIKEPEARLNVLENIKKITKPGAPVYITVYEGSGKGNEGVTKSGYQLNRKTADYLEEIQQVFPNAKRKGKLIVATNSGSANSSTTIRASSTEGYVYTYCDKCGKKNRVKVAFNSFNEPFNDTEYKCKYCGTRNLLTDPHSYNEKGNVVEASQSYLDRIEELMEQGLDEDTASREAYAEFYPDEYDADDYDEIYSATTSSSRYWYFTRHGVQPGSVPKYVNILDIVDTPEGSYFLADGVILTKDLRNYEIKERKPKNDVVEAGYYDIPEPPIDPPEDDSWTEVDGWIEDVDLDVDAIIEVLDDGSWIYEDETYPWAVSKDSYNGDHYSYEYYVHIGDPGTIVEDFDDVIEKYIPSEEGRYHLKCKATLKYFIEGVEVKQSYHDEEVYKDNANVEFDEYDSKVENVSVERIW